LGLSIFYSKGLKMKTSDSAFTQWVFPLLFIGCAGWIIWHGASYIMAFGGFTDALAARYRQINFLDYAALIGLPVFLILGVLTVKRAQMEMEDYTPLDQIAMFIGRVTMLLIALVVGVMMYEVILRYVFERPTLWANELSLWMAGFVFILAGFYAMQQRSHIRIFLLYDMLPRNLQRTCDTISTFLILLFAFFLVYGGYGEAKAKLLRWETFGTVFDPPIPATLKPLVLLVVCLVAIQSLLNLINDWNKEPVIHTAADDIDQDEIERLKESVGEK
jgi:TRAP-type C4-dicarboxylate transport system permease small subunit|tara:strand:+ start:949 stop:1773 length:825 start_codon:yes stop_codon:yes gene_type:complete